MPRTPGTGVEERYAAVCRHVLTRLSWGVQSRATKGLGFRGLGFRGLGISRNPKPGP